MKTRFDDSEIWIDANKQKHLVDDMDTMHLLNVLAMFWTKPNVVLTMLINDIENGDDVVCVMLPNIPYVRGLQRARFEHVHIDKSELIREVTSMNAKALFDYAYCSPLGMAIRDELVRRNVNVAVALAVLTGQERWVHE